MPTLKLLKTEKEIACEVAVDDKLYLRKSAECKAQTGSTALISLTWIVLCDGQIFLGSACLSP